MSYLKSNKTQYDSFPGKSQNSKKFSAKFKQNPTTSKNHRVFLNPTLHEPFEGTRYMRGGARGAPPIFSVDLYIVWVFGGYMQVYNHKTSLHGKFQISPICACGAMARLWAKLTSFLTKIASNNNCP